MRRVTGIAAVLGLLMQAPAVAAGPAVPVRYGGLEDLDACTSLGAVRGLDPAGDNFLALRTGPGSKYAMTDKLHEDQNVHVCDERGNWLGIVYTDGDTDCGVSSPVAKRSPYHGPCKSGWVFKRYILIIAG